VNHVQKIKPRVEQICQQLGLQYATEENEGRMYINLQGGAAVMPPMSSPHHGKPHHGGQQQHHQQQHGGYQQGGYQQGGYQQGGYQGGHQQQGYGGQQQNNQEQEIEQAVVKMLPKLLRKLSSCCTVM
jgi:hypothetical protein